MVIYPSFNHNRERRNGRPQDLRAAKLSLFFWNQYVSNICLNQVISIWFFVSFPSNDYQPKSYLNADYVESRACPVVVDRESMNLWPDHMTQVIVSQHSGPLTFVSCRRKRNRFTSARYCYWFQLTSPVQIHLWIELWTAFINYMKKTFPQPTEHFCVN